MAVTRQVIMELGAKQAASLKQSWGIMGRSLGRIRNAAKGLASTFLSIKGVIIGALVRGAFRMLRNAVRSVTQAAIRQEDAVVRLNNAMRTAGVYSDALSKRTQTFASSLQAVTRFGDEAILEMQALLITYGVTADKLEKATLASLDFATATGRDVRSAALTVGKAAAGFTGELSRYGIIVETEGIAKSKVFEKVLAKLREQFGGRAQADVNTYAGRVKQMGDAWGDVLESFGDVIIKSPEVLQMIRDATKHFQELKKWVDENAVAFRNILVPALELAGEWMKELGIATKIVVEQFLSWRRALMSEAARAAEDAAKELRELTKAGVERSKAAEEAARAVADARKKHLGVEKQIGAEQRKQVQSMARQFGLMSSLEKAQVRYLAEQLKGAKGFEFFQRMTEAQREMVGRSKILGAITEKRGFGERAAEQYLGAGFMRETAAMQKVDISAEFKNVVDVKMDVSARKLAEEIDEKVIGTLRRAVAEQQRPLIDLIHSVFLGRRAGVHAAGGIGS